MPDADSRADPSPAPPSDFIRDQVRADLADPGWSGQIATRFPPEPNGYLHIGHAKSIALNFGIASEFNGRCHLRFDDTNPAKEEQRYIDAIQRDVAWLGGDWGAHLYYASDYFQQLYDWAVLLIRHGKAYVDDQTPDEIRHNRGTLTTPGTPSPFRDRPAEENLALFQQMKEGAFPDGSRVLRARIDMASPNINLRDPVLYRILRKPHPRTGDTWCIYPMYDWAHGQSDWIEGVTHSLCDTSFEIHRPLYDWCIDQLIELGVAPEKAARRPRQYEFARMNITHTVLSKRKLRALVESGSVRDWDDPRMPTLSGMRRRGYPPAAIRSFCVGVGVAKRENVIEFARLEHAVREELNRAAPRVMAVLDPLKVVITNYPEGDGETLEAVNNPEDPAAGSRQVPFGRELYIERGDFMEDPPRKFFRLAPGREVRLRYAYFITCQEAIKDETGAIVELRCTYDPATRGGDAPDGRKVKGTLHWVSARHAVNSEVRLYDHLFTDEHPEQTPSTPEAETLAEEAALADPAAARQSDDLLQRVNPESLVITEGWVEPAAAEAPIGATVQFERLGYFALDPDATPQRPVFNRTTTLRDSWSKQKGK